MSVAGATTPLPDLHYGPEGGGVREGRT